MDVRGDEEELLSQSVAPSTAPAAAAPAAVARRRLVNQFIVIFMG